MSLPHTGVAPDAAGGSDPAPPVAGHYRVPHYRMGPIRRSIRELGLALITLGFIILFFVVYQLYGTNITQRHHQKALAKGFNAAVAAHPSTTPAKTETAPATSPTTVAALPSAPTAGAIDHLVIPKIGVNQFVVEGTDENDLREGPGHYTGTAYPGQLGNVGIAGHRTTYGAPFYELNELNTGDVIKITDLDNRTWIYTVSKPPQVVSPDDTAVLDPTTFAQLTLTTCNPRFSATSRLIVFARLVGRALPAAPVTTKPVVAALPGDSTTPQTVPALTTLGTGTNKAWPPSIFYGSLLLIGWITVRIWINRTRRWYRLGAYVVGVGVCLIPLWFLFENVILLLPQSI